MTRDTYTVTGTRTINGHQEPFQMPVAADNPEQAVHLFLNEVIIDPDEFNMVGTKD